MLRLVLIGKTGSGKSETGNTILGRKAFRAAMSATSITRDSSMAEGNFEGRMVSVVDTPGLFDTGDTMERIVKEVGQCDELSRPGPHALLLVIRVGRFTEEERKTVDAFAQQFGPGMFDYLIIIFTGGDELVLAETTVEEFTKAVPGLSDLLNKAGNRYVGFNNRGTDMEKKEQVRKLLNCVDEMVASNGSHYTTQMYMAAQAASLEAERQRLLSEQLLKAAEEARVRAEEEARNRAIVQQREQQLLQEKVDLAMQLLITDFVQRKCSVM